MQKSLSKPHKTRSGTMNRRSTSTLIRSVAFSSPAGRHSIYRHGSAGFTAHRRQREIESARGLWEITDVIDANELQIRNVFTAFYLRRHHWAVIYEWNMNQNWWLLSYDRFEECKAYTKQDYIGSVWTINAHVMRRKIFHSHDIVKITTFSPQWIMGMER